MDAKLQRLNHAVALRADAWLTAPTDPGLYSRLVAAVLERRAYLSPELDQAVGPEGSEPVQEDELTDELASTRPPRRVADVLAAEGWVGEQPSEE